MCWQINVHPEDQNLQRIFWEDSNQQIKFYRLTTVTYGLSCAPFLAVQTIEQLIANEGHRFPLAVPSLSKGRYVDDIFDGADSIHEAKLIMHELAQLCHAGGFPLQKWNSNVSELFPPSTTTPKEEGVPVEIEASQIKVLELCWHLSKNVFKGGTSCKQHFLKDFITKK
ncbi:uncharacterized protein LOC112589234 [Harpegnathos saltator]|uniref:uncharacterized protein LOC112589234 n=1 Tax=Harpegnathos saltator TaxID=610380 RepID=UPI000DBEE59E|nr:uncharacterized protein LOC112589234 [Harpegnathos saltator]